MLHTTLINHYHFITHHTSSFSFFFFNDTATTEIYTLSLHDALPICFNPGSLHCCCVRYSSTGQAKAPKLFFRKSVKASRDRKSTRLNSSHSQISYAVFCLKKKKNTYKCHFLR